MLAAFAASLVECVEALTIVLAVGTVRGWRWALAGSAAALGLLVVLVAFFGTYIARIPLPLVQVSFGTLSLMFGLRWLRKAILRSVGVIALHDEAQAYAKQTAALRGPPVATPRSWDSIAFATAFNIVMLEGVEVVFIIIAMGAGGQLIVPASLGAAAALGVVVCLGVAMHRPLANIPENTLKFAVGVLLSAFGTFWLGEGIHLEWPADDWSLVAVIVFFLLVAETLVLWLRPRARLSGQRIKRPASTRPRGILLRLLQELLSLFVDDSVFAAGILAWAALAWWSAARLPGGALLKCGLLAVGFAVLLLESVLRASQRP